MTPEQYKQEQAELAHEAQHKVAIASAMFLGGGIFAGGTPSEDSRDFVYTASRSIASVNAASIALADGFVSGIAGKPAIGLGVDLHEERRIQYALVEILRDDPAEPEPRLLRVATSEPHAAGRIAIHRAMKAHQLRRYRWLLDADPCDRCRALARRTWHVMRPPVSHPNCTCVPVPILKSEAA